MARRRELGAALAAAFLAGAWTEEAMARRAGAALDPPPRWVRALVRDVLAAYHRPPSDRPRELGAHIARLLPPVALPRVVRWWPYEPAMAAGRWPVPAIATPGELAERLELDAGQLAWLVDARGLARTAPERRLRHYTALWLPRPGGPPRLIERPKLRLKEIQRWILREILDAVPPHDAAHGFARGRSARTHAALHVGRGTVVRLDLEDFFSCVGPARVFGLFRGLGYPEAVAHALTGLCVTVLPRSDWEAAPAPADPGLGTRHERLGRRLAAPHLPQGAPTSPALASLAAFGLDRRLAALAPSLGACYSRYADDLTFSGAADLPAGTLGRVIAGIAREEGFRVAPAKTRVRRRNDRQLVCGVVVNERPNVPRRDFDRLKAILHDAERNGPAAANRGGVADFRAHLLGRIAWVASLHPERGRRLRARFDRIRWAD